MPSFLDDVQELFEETDFYSILNIAKTANNDESATFVYLYSLLKYPNVRHVSFLDLYSRLKLVELS